MPPMVTWLGPVMISAAILVHPSDRDLGSKLMNYVSRYIYIVGMYRGGMGGEEGLENPIDS